MQPVGPHLLVDVPVTESGPVVPAPEEPAVVEHEALHTDPCRQVRHRLEPCRVVVEVGRLPGVHGDRPRGAGMAVTASLMAVEDLRDLVETAAVDAVQPG